MRRAILTLFWILTDACVFIGTYVLAYFAKVGWILSSDLPFRTYLSAVLLTTPAWLLVMITMRNFSLSRVQRSPRNFAYIVYACIIGMAGFTLAFYFLKQTLFSRLLLLLAGILSAIGVSGWHVLFDILQRIVLRAGQPTYPLLVIGTNREAARLIERLQRRKSHLTPVAILDNKGGPREISGIPVLGKLNKLEEIFTEKRITHLVQCDALEQSINLVSACTQRGITYMLLPSLLGIIQQQEKVMQLEGQPVVQVEHHSKWQWFFR